MLLPAFACRRLLLQHQPIRPGSKELVSFSSPKGRADRSRFWEPLSFLLRLRARPVSAYRMHLVLLHLEVAIHFREDYYAARFICPLP